jgi:hypothetical protein
MVSPFAPAAWRGVGVPAQNSYNTSPIGDIQQSVLLRCGMRSRNIFQLTTEHSFESMLSGRDLSGEAPRASSRRYPNPQVFS